MSMVCFLFLYLLPVSVFISLFVYTCLFLVDLTLLSLCSWRTAVCGSCWGLVVRPSWCWGARETALPSPLPPLESAGRLSRHPLRLWYCSPQYLRPAVFFQHERSVLSLFAESEPLQLLHHSFYFSLLNICAFFKWQRFYSWIKCKYWPCVVTIERRFIQTYKTIVKLRFGHYKMTFWR